MLSLNVTADGPGKSNFKYHWKKRGIDELPVIPTISGRKTTNLKISSVTSSDSGSYYCVVMNQWGSMMNSNKAIVNVLRK